MLTLLLQNVFFFFLPFSITYNFLLKTSHNVFGNRIRDVKVKHSPVCVLYFQYLQYYFTFDIRCVGFPHVKQFCYTSWMAYSLTQLSYYLPGDSIRSHSLQACPTRLFSAHRCTCNSQIQVVAWASDQAKLLKLVLWGLCGDSIA